MFLTMLLRTNSIAVQARTDPIPAESKKECNTRIAYQYS